MNSVLVRPKVGTKDASGIRKQRVLNMRTRASAFLVVLLGFAVLSCARASDGFDELVKLIKSGVNEEVLTAYVNNSPSAYDLTVDEILYLNDLGVSATIIQSVVQHGKDVRDGKVAGAEPI